MQWIDKETVEYLGQLTSRDAIQISHMDFLGYDPEIRIKELKNNIRKDIKAIKVLRGRNATKIKLEKQNQEAMKFLKKTIANSLKPIQKGILK